MLLEQKRNKAAEEKTCFRSSAACGEAVWVSKSATPSAALGPGAPSYQSRERCIPKSAGNGAAAGGEWWGAFHFLQSQQAKGVTSSLGRKWFEVFYMKPPKSAWSAVCGSTGNKSIWALNLHVSVWFSPFSVKWAARALPASLFLLCLGLGAGKHLPA